MALGRVKVMTGCSSYVFVFGFIWFLYFCILKVMEEELAALAELRMKEESATELSVGLLFLLDSPLIFLLDSPHRLGCLTRRGTSGSRRGERPKRGRGGRGRRVR